MLFIQKDSLNKYVVLVPSYLFKGIALEITNTVKREGYSILL